MYFDRNPLFTSEFIQNLPNMHVSCMSPYDIKRHNHITHYPLSKYIMIYTYNLQHTFLFQSYRITYLIGQELWPVYLIGSLAFFQRYLLHTVHSQHHYQSHIQMKVEILLVLGCCLLLLLHHISLSQIWGPVPLKLDAGFRLFTGDSDLQLKLDAGFRPLA